MIADLPSVAQSGIDGMPDTVEAFKPFATRGNIDESRENKIIDVLETLPITFITEQLIRIQQANHCLNWQCN